MAEKIFKYDEDSIKSHDWKEHIRFRPGMQIGKLGDGSAMDDGIYVLLKETIDNCIDEYTMGYGKNIDIELTDHSAKVRDYKTSAPNRWRGRQTKLCCHVLSFHPDAENT